VIWTTALTNACPSIASLVVVVVVVVAQLLQLQLQCVGVCIVQGGVIVINIGWYCDLDHSIDQCLPQYSFTSSSCSCSSCTTTTTTTTGCRRVYYTGWRDSDQYRVVL